MNILVTGATGFLGSHLCPFLERKGHKVTVLSSAKADLRREGSLEQLNGNDYSLIFHLAAWTQAGDFCLRHPAEQWVINQRINTNVLDWWQQRQPRAKLIFMGTSCAYAPGSDLREENYMLGKPVDSLYTYAMTKRILFQGARAMQLQFGLRWLCAVPSTLYGSGYHLDGRQMHFIFDLIRKIIRGKVYGEPVILWGNGYQRRELVLVDDFVKVLWHLTENVDNDIVNIGAGEEHSIRHFSELICAEVGYPAESIQYDTSKYTGAESKCLNVDKLREIMPEWQPAPLLVGLQETIKWFWETRAYETPIHT